MMKHRMLVEMCPCLAGDDVNKINFLIMGQVLFSLCYTNDMINSLVIDLSKLSINTFCKGIFSLYLVLMILLLLPSSKQYLLHINMFHLYCYLYYIPILT